MTLGSDLDQIKALMAAYLDGLYDGDTTKLAAAFHPVSHLYWVQDGVVQDEPRDAWFERVRNRKSAAAQGLSRHDAILSIDVSGPETAFVKVACAMPPRFFTDYLSCLKTREGWRIVSKTFRTETR
jgi:hypothetical protein